MRPVGPDDRLHCICRALGHRLMKIIHTEVAGLAGAMALSRRNANSLFANTPGLIGRSRRPFLSPVPSPTRSSERGAGSVAVFVRMVMDFNYIIPLFFPTVSAQSMSSGVGVGRGGGGLAQPEFCEYTTNTSAPKPKANIPISVAKLVFLLSMRQEMPMGWVCVCVFVLQLGPKKPVLHFSTLRLLHFNLI